MTDVGFSRRDLERMTRGLAAFPDVASMEIYAAQVKNADEAERYMLALAPKDEGITRAGTGAQAYKRRDRIGFIMATSRPNRPGASATSKTERIRAILFANETDFFYGVWNLNKKRWKGRMRRAMTKAARRTAGVLP